MEKDLLKQIKQIYFEGKENKEDIYDIINNIYIIIPTHKLTVNEKVQVSATILRLLDRDDRLKLAKKLLEEQVVRQREKLSLWSTITAQSSQIDTGYIAQHLVSLQTQIPGQGMRGKGDDLSDGSEVKSANFLDSLDKRGATAPRWNFTAINPQIMEQFLTYESLYLLSMDLNSNGLFRTRIWKVNVLKHKVLRERYIEWMKIKGYPKFQNTTDYPSVNFQLFPPRNGTEENFARHGNGRSNGFQPIRIALEGVEGADLIFRADETPTGEILISKF